MPYQIEDEARSALKRAVEQIRRRDDLIVSVSEVPSEQRPAGIAGIWRVERSGNMGRVVAWAWLRPPVGSETWSLRAYAGALDGSRRRDFVEDGKQARVELTRHRSEEGKIDEIVDFLVSLLEWAEHDRRPGE